MPFLQKDVLALMENKAISCPQPPPQPPPPIGGGSLSARPMYGSRPRSALGDRSNEEREQLQRPTTSDGNSRRIAGYTFPPGSSPRPEVLVANRMAGRSHSISALEAARRHRLGTIDPGEPDVDELLPPLSGVPFQLPSKDSYWFDQSSLQQGDLGGMEGLPPPQRPPSIVDGLLSTSMADVAEGGDVIGRVAPAAAPGGTSPPLPARSAAVSGGESGGAPAGGVAGGAGSGGVAGGGGPGGGGAAGTDDEYARLGRQVMVQRHVDEAVEERTAFLTRIFQERLAKQLSALEALRQSEARAHAKEVAQLKAAFEERLAEAVEKVRVVHNTNRDAVAILQKNKKLQYEVRKLTHEKEAAMQAARDAEAREERRKEEGDQVVQQLLGQLQEKEALLAAGAGAMSEADREEMLQKERQRAQQAAAREKKRIEDAMKAEREKSKKEIEELKVQLEDLKMELSDAKQARLEAEKNLERETKHKKAAIKAREDLEAKWKLEEARRERVKEQEKVVSAQRKDITSALGHMRTFTLETHDHLNVDLACLSCLKPLLEPQVLVPCGHSICNECSFKLDAEAAASGEYGAAKYCPLCTREGRHPPRPGVEEDDDALSPIENFPNLMLDTVLSRLRQKVQDVQGQINVVLSIFEKGGNPLPGAKALAGPPASPPAKPSGATAATPPADAK